MVSLTMRPAIASGMTPSSPYPVSMRMRWSSFATISIAPSSTPFRPSFQASATRIPNPAMSSSSVVGTISTAIWLPLRASNACSFCSSAATWSALRVPVRSVTRARGGGTAIAARGTSSGANSAMTPLRSAHANMTPVLRRIEVFCVRLVTLRGRCWSRGRGAEVDCRRLRDHLLVRHREVRLHPVTEQHRREVRRERSHGRVVGPYRVDVALAFHRDTIFDPLELNLQVAERIDRLEVRIVLRYGEQSREGTG